jgi:hypothetical protein
MPADLFGEEVAGLPDGVVLPQTNTLRRYGLTAQDWVNLLVAQGGVCAVCRRVPRTGRFNTDHEHVKGWKKMPASRRKLYVRGIICHFCNHYYVGRGITVAKAEAVAEYLRRYEARTGEKEEL